MRIGFRGFIRSRMNQKHIEGIVLNDKVKYVERIDKSKPDIGVCLCED